MGKYNYNKYIHFDDTSNQLIIKTLKGNIYNFVNSLFSSCYWRSQSSRTSLYW